MSAPLAAAASAALLDLGPAFHAVLVRRPAESVRSPYVADIEITGPADGRPWKESRCALAWAPSLDLGGQCVPGARLLVTPAPPRKAPSAKPRRTEYWIQLVQATEPECGEEGQIWIGSRPSMGTDIARAAIERGLVPALSGYPRLRAEVAGAVAAGSRVDFVLDHKEEDGMDKADEKREGGEEDGKGKKKGKKKREGKVGEKRRSSGGALAELPCVVEVKNVVCADYNPSTAPSVTEKRRCVFVGRGEPYERAGVFPWGTVAQEYMGERVVSSRAVKHVVELGEAAREGRARAVLLFVVNRGDCKSFRACHEACPVLADEIEIARAKGMEAIAIR